MLKKRIVPCLDVMNGRSVKGVNFRNLVDAGSPVAMARNYTEQGADELVFLDITATIEGRKTFAALVRDVAREVSIPFTVGGGVASVDDAAALLDAGADKVAVNSAAVRDPALISRLAARFGSQAVVLAVDAGFDSGAWRVRIGGGRVPTGIDVRTWVREGEERGAGELLLTSIDRDGTGTGFDLPLLRSVRPAVSIPVIASGGAGTGAHFVELFRENLADGGLAAGIFHFGTLPVPHLKRHLRTYGVPIR